MILNRFTTLLRKLRSLSTRSARERDMNDEMRFHIEMEASDLQHHGMTHDAARRQAAIAFGGIERTKETARDVTGFRLLDDLRQDLRYALRHLRSGIGFTATTLLTLALGIGATTTMYTIVRTMTTLPFDLPNADRVMHIGQTSAAEGCAACNLIAIGNFITIRDESRTLQSVAVLGPWNPTLRGTDRTDVVNGVFVTSSFFEALRTPALLGRTIVSADSATDRRNVVVISEQLWRTRFASDPNVVGTRAVFDGAALTIVGVIATRSVFPQLTDAWTVRATRPSEAEQRLGTDFTAIGRLRDGATLQQARAELTAIASRTFGDKRGPLRRTTLGVMRLADWQSAAGGDELLMLTLSVALLLLVACINLAGLLVARLKTRDRELALRAAIGASAPRIARQLLTETIVLTIASSLLGAAFAFIGVRVVRDVLASSTTTSIATWPAMTVDIGALGVSLLVGGLTGLLVGVWPAVRFARGAVVSGLHGGLRTSTSPRETARVRSALVVMQMAFAVVLLTTATLLARSERNIRAIQPGFRASDLLTFKVTTPIRTPSDTTTPDSTRFERLAKRIAEVPGVLHTGAILGLPYAKASVLTGGFDIEGKPIDGARVSAQIVPVSTDYFATMELPILRGRAFSERDTPAASPVAIVDRLFAERYFHDENPVGRVLVANRERIEIVGVAERVNRAQESPSARPQGIVYRPTNQRQSRAIQMVVRINRDSKTLIPDIGAAVHDFNRDFGTVQMKSMQAVIADSNAAGRVLSGMMLVFALATMLISALGLYGLVSYSVARRTREFGVRRALGADASAVLRLVIGYGGRLAIFGVLIGAVGSLVITRGMRSMLFGITPSDPASFAGVAVSMALIALVATYLPARRATRVDPMTTLRED